MRLALSFLATAAMGLCATTSPAAAGDAQSYKVELNKTEIVRLPGAASSIIVGNPKIADVTVQATDLIFIVGRGYGETNLVILDSAGETMMDADLQVVNTLPKHGLRVYEGSQRKTYSCIPFCGPSPVLGDNREFIGNNTTQEQQLDPFTAFVTSLSQSVNDSRASSGGNGVPIPAGGVPNSATPN